jgi:hypothetical protein
LRDWKPETAAEAREGITEVIELAGHDVLDVALPKRRSWTCLISLQPGEISLARKVERLSDKIRRDGREDLESVSPIGSHELGFVSSILFCRLRPPSP